MATSPLQAHTITRRSCERKHMTTATYELGIGEMRLTDRIKEANDACDALTLTRNGQEVGIVISVEEWERLQTESSDIAAVLTVYDSHTPEENRGPWRRRLDHHMQRANR